MDEFAEYFSSVFWGNIVTDEQNERILRQEILRVNYFDLIIIRNIF